MKFTYDSFANALYVKFNNKKVKRTEEVIEEVLFIDYDTKGEIVGIEILCPFNGEEE